jgi:glycosyltransferase involved in cell wall biosynthesis
MLCENNYDEQDVAAIITAMTDAERPFLRDTVESVLSNPGIGQIIICVEENNTWIDTTLDTLITVPRLEIIRMPLAPPGAVRNRALAYVKLPWIAYCDGDDIWCDKKILTQRTYARERRCDFVGADHYLTNEDGRIRAFAIARYLPLPSAWMVRTEVMRQYPFNESLYEGECGEWWNRTNGIVKKVRCPKMLLRYRIRSGSLSAKTSSMRRKAQIVSLANIPGLGAIVLLLTWCIWLFTRQKKYVWYKGWGQQISTNREEGDLA